MKKNLTLRLLATLTIAMLFSLGASAQFFGDYIEGGAGAAAGQAIDTVTVSSQTGLYAEPDAYFSPAYNTANNTGLGANQFWRWTITGVTSTGTEATVGNYIWTAADTSNYIEIVWGAGAGTVTIDVAERNGAVSCEGANQSMTVQVIGTPTVTYSADAANGAPAGGIIGANISVCETDVDRLNDVVQLAFTQAGIIGNPSYQAQYSITVDTIQADATVSNIPGRDEDFLGSAGSQVASNSATLNLAQPTGGFAAITNAGGTSRSTVYTYTIAGVNDRISRKSDFLNNTTALATAWSWYDTGAETIAITVNPAPVTGPIYHISNMWAN